MSDSKTIYRKVQEFVKCLYPGELRGNFHRNMNTMIAMITGIIIGKETQLPQIANHVPENIKLQSTEKRFKRLIINETVDEETFFMPFIQGLLNRLNLEQMVLAIDASLIGRGCMCLMINLIYKKRALPLALTVVKGNKGHLPEETHIELVKKLHPLIPESTKQVILLGDGEFDGTIVQQSVSDFGWKYVVRTSSNITLYANDEPFAIDTLAALLPKGHYKHLTDCTITRKKYGPVTAIAWWGEDNDEPIFLVTNFKSASMACQYYAKRFTIETFFSDQKSRGFNIDKSHLSSPSRLTRLMYASCLAYVWIIFFWYLGIGDRFVQTNTPG